MVCLLPASAAAAPAASPAPQAPTPRITLQVIDRTGRALEPDRLGAVQDRRGRALSISQGDWLYLLQSPIAAVLLGIAALALIVPLILRARGKGEMLSQLAGDED